jgi:hypothetical protein
MSKLSSACFATRSVKPLCVTEYFKSDLLFLLSFCYDMDYCSGGLLQQCKNLQIAKENN